MGAGEVRAEVVGDRTAGGVADECVDEVAVRERVVGDLAARCPQWFLLGEEAFRRQDVEEVVVTVDIGQSRGMGQDV